MAYNVTTHFSASIGKFWYLIDDEYSEPIIVSPAIYQTPQEAESAGNKTVESLTSVVDRRLAESG